MFKSKELSSIRMSEAAQKIIRSECVVELENIDHITGLLPKNRSIRVSKLKPIKNQQIKKKIVAINRKDSLFTRTRNKNFEIKSPRTLIKLKAANKLRSGGISKSASQSNKAKVSVSLKTKEITNGKGKHVTTKVNTSETNNEMVVFNDKYVNNEELNCTEGYLTNTDGVVEVNILDIMAKNLEGVKETAKNFKVVPFIDPDEAAAKDEIENEARKKKEEIMDSVEATISKIFGLDSKSSDEETPAKKPSVTKTKETKRKDTFNNRVVNKKRELKAKNLKLRRSNELLRSRIKQQPAIRSSLRQTNRDLIRNTRYRHKGKPNYKELAGLKSRRDSDKKVGVQKSVDKLKAVTEKKIIEEKPLTNTPIKSTSVKSDRKTENATKQLLKSTSKTNLIKKPLPATRYQVVVPKKFDPKDLQFKNNKLVYSPKKKVESPSPSSEESKENSPKRIIKQTKLTPPSDIKDKLKLPMSPAKSLMKYSWKDNTIETWRKRKFKLTTVVKVWEIKPDPLFALKNNPLLKSETKKIEIPIKNDLTTKSPKINPPDLTKLNAAIPKDLSYVDFVKRYEENKKLYNELSETYKAETKGKKNENSEIGPRKDSPIEMMEIGPKKESSNSSSKKFKNAPKPFNNQKTNENNKTMKKPVQDLEEVLDCNIIMAPSDSDDENEEDELGEEEEECEEDLDEDDMEELYNDDCYNSELEEDYQMDEDDSELDYLCRVSLPQSNNSNSKTNNEIRYEESKKDNKDSKKSDKKDDFTEDKIVIFQDMLDQVQKVRLPKDWEVRCTEFGITFLSSERVVTVSANLDINIKVDNKNVELMGAPKNVSCIEDLSIVLDIISTIENDDFMLVYN